MSENWEDDGDPWTVKTVRRSYETPWFAVDDHDVINPAGNPGHYGVIRVPRLAIGVLPIEPNGQVHLVGQWRFPLGRYSWEIPEGGSDSGEAPEMTAHRELAEETGLRAASLIKVLEMDLSNCVSDERAFCFLAFGLTPGQTKPDETEVLKRRTAAFADVLARCVDGRIRDAITVATVLRAHHMAVTGELPSDLAQALLNSVRLK
jgi:8-oxo-dGTP pyrophosphatase MutT (NUDIX family)